MSGQLEGGGDVVDQEAIDRKLLHDLAIIVAARAGIIGRDLAETLDNLRNLAWAIAAGSDGDDTEKG